MPSTCTCSSDLFVYHPEMAAMLGTKVGSAENRLSRFLFHFKLYNCIMYSLDLDIGA